MNRIMCRASVVGTCIVFGVGLFGGIVFVTTVEARSAQWNFGGVTLRPQSTTGWFGLRGVRGSVQYHARVVDANTGAVIPPNAEVPAGTQVQFEFVPHKSTDIHWFGSGYGFDSPYGDWVEGAGRPEGALCQNKNYVTNVGGSSARAKAYVSLAVDPPEKTIAGLDGVECITMEDGISQSCTLTESGEIPSKFNFAKTRGKFHSSVVFTGGKYPRKRGLMGRCHAYHQFSYTLRPAARSISYPISVIDTDGSPPESPTVFVEGDAQCVVNTAYTITIRATDPDGDGVRYGIDWDNNGSVDQFAPAVGYAPSGTSQTVSRTYSTAGEKTIRVLAMDEGGLSSGWVSHTAACTEPDTEEEEDEPPSGDVGIILGGDTGGADDLGLEDASLDLRAVPSLVQQGNTTQLHWSAAEVDSCRVTGNGDIFEGVVSPASGETSSPIEQQTTYTLLCVDLEGGILTDTATVNIVPIFEEI